MALATDREKCAHLLRRFGMGASENEIDLYLKNGMNGAIELLLDDNRKDEGFDIDIEEFKNPQNNQVPMPQVVNWWTLRFLMTQRPLTEKLTLFWHDHFATSASKVAAPMIMFTQNETLRKNATGNFRDLMMEASKDPAMIIWLDNQFNVKGKANENFAREVMELFTLGIGHYSEKDIQESARAFTGWSLRQGRSASQNNKNRTAEFQFRPFLHDNGPKTFFGHTANLSGEDVINILCDNPRTAEYIAWKMWEWFAYPNPEPAVLARVSKAFRDSNLDIKTLLRTIMHAPEFYSARAERAIVKNPVDFCIVTMRQLGIGSIVADAVKESPPGEFPRQMNAVAGITTNTMKAMGMWLLYPPDVAGWDGGDAWISTGTMVERIAWADRIFGTAKAARLPFQYPAYSLFEKDRTPSGLVHKLLSIFDAPVNPAKIPTLIEAANRAVGAGLTEKNANVAAATVARLIFATPEFQFA